MKNFEAIIVKRLRRNLPAVDPFDRENPRPGIKDELCECPEARSTSRHNRQKSGLLFRRSSARLVSCKKFCPQRLTGETRISRRVASISRASSERSLGMGEHRKLPRLFTKT
jgi:hypothetical protein